MNRLPDTYFARMYEENPDPWKFDDRWYEQRKRAITAAILPRARFRHAFEPGCSTGALTEVLAPRCDRLTATDIADEALTAARTRLDRVPNVDVSFTRWALGDRWPDESFDLIVLSEVCYYLTLDALTPTLDEACAHLSDDGVLLAAHWRHPVPDYPLLGDEVHAALARHPGVTRTARYEDPDVLVELFTRPEADLSVAYREGLVD